MKESFIIFLVLAGAILAGCMARPQIPPPTPVPTTTPVTPTPVPDTIRIVTNQPHGQILTDAAGMTLYYFARDRPGFASTACTGTCAAVWPPFETPVIRVSPPLNPKDFGEFIRQDGAKQLTYLGWPLYYYVNDTVPGDTKGYGINQLWYLVSPGGVVTTAPTTAATTRPTTAPTSGGGY